MKKQMFRLFSFGLVFVMLLSSSAQIAVAQDGQPPTPSAPNVPLPDDPHTGLRQDQNGQWYMPEEQATQMDPASPTSLATGGPDNFGYTWDSSVALNWIDAGGGTNTGIGSSTNHAGPIDIGFSFKYYENAYTQLYISRYGFVAFNENYIDRSQSEIPNPDQPNDVIAPNWVPAYSVNGYVHYLSGGTAPNRWFAVEWNRLESDCCGTDGAEEYTFEVILYENGDIVFQYQTMTFNGDYMCQASGIEDSQGLDGLSITNFCVQVASNHAVHIYRPASSARVNISPLYQGAFTYAGEMSVFQIPIRNTGELGSDTYDLTLSSFWLTSLYAANGTTLLIDTDSDGVIDTGPVSQGGTVNIFAKVQAPGGANVGDANTAAITVRSSLNTSKSKTVTLQTAIPTAFAQAYRDNYDGAMSLYLAQPGGQSVKKTTDWYWYGYDPAVAEAPNGNFAYAWSKGRCVGSNCNIYAYDIEYTLLNKYGETVGGVRKLTDNSSATVNTYDSSPIVAAAPDGRTGILWYRYGYQYLNNTSQYNYNLFFAVLDASGNVVYGPANLTNYTVWGPWNDPNVPQVYSPRITATGDNRFVLAWQKYYQVAGCSSNDCSINDIYYAVRDTGGAEVKGITQFTYDTTGSSYEGYYGPNLTGLTGNRALMTWYRNSDSDIYYAVLDSAGNVVKDKINLSGDGSSSRDWGSDAAQLSDGKIVVGWTGGLYPNYNIRFAVLDTSYNRTAFPSSLSNPAATTGNGYVSVAADASGHAILTWMDYNSNYRRNLYYALVNGNGGILTSPMIFRSSQDSTPYIETSYYGYGNTSYSSSIATGADTAIWLGGSRAGGAPGGAAPIGVNYANYGRTTATGVVMTATLGTDLTYLGDTSGHIPSVVGDQVTWNLPDMSFLEKHQFMLYVAVPDTATIGTLYPVTFALTENETDANSSDNTANLNVMAALQVYLPLISR